MAALLAAIANAVTGGLVALFGSWRIVLFGLLTAVVGILLYNLVCDVIEEMLQWLLAELNGMQAPDGTPSTAYQFAGLAAYLALHLKIIECISFVINVTVLKWTIVKVPFMKW